ncbi:hypothetical protein DYB25_007424 [Aphanomyces astaci]|uniref:Phospholipase/carboxylesterase/thioesterase domain-containing protein n=1 Tax=Aphanomyces astaci TaxID=112090 RepID=A0A397AG94_APHAT|nr:hypothetical protein DYB25_007424 [Aphanomyces astaci]
MARRLAVGDEVELLRVRGKVLKVLPESGVALLHIHATSTTIWAFLHELAPVSASTSWTPTSFPSMLQHWQVHSCPTSNENLLLFLHGLGDTHESLFTLGQAMQLPQTAFASFRAPHALPFDLGYAWFDHALDAQGDVLPHHVPDPRRLQRYYQYHQIPFTSRRCGSLDQVVAAWLDALHTLQTDYNWPLHRVFLMGFGHGGTVALHVVAACSHRLGGVVSVSGALLSTATVSPSSTPGLVLHSSNDPLIRTDMFTATTSVMSGVKAKSVPYHPVALSNKQPAGSHYEPKDTPREEETDVETGAFDASGSNASSPPVLTTLSKSKPTVWPHFKFILTMIALNITIFVFEEMKVNPLVGPSGDLLLRMGAQRSDLIFQGEWWRLFTAMFLHGGLYDLSLYRWIMSLFDTNLIGVAIVNLGIGLLPFVNNFAHLSGFLSNATKACPWCKYLDCVPAPWWNCDAPVQGECFGQQFTNGTLVITCPGGRNVTAPTGSAFSAAVCVSVCS